MLHGTAAFAQVRLASWRLGGSILRTLFAVLARCGQQGAFRNHCAVVTQIGLSDFREKRWHAA
jgi:hypothetical protein